MKVDSPGHDYLYGINTVLSLLDYNTGSRKIYELLLNSTKKKSPRINDIIEKARLKKIPIKEIPLSDFSQLVKRLVSEKYGSFRTGEENIINSQGIIAKVSAYNYGDLYSDLEKYSLKNKLLVILDSITDVGNFGSILRNCSAFAADGVIIAKDRSVEASSRVSRISSGALEQVRVYSVINIVRTMQDLKEKGFWVYGTTLSIERRVLPANQVEFTFPMAIVFGSEERGISRLVEENCDFLVSLEMPGKMQSLNVAAATGIFLYIIKNSEKKA